MSTETATSYRDHVVWDDESGERYFIEGHLPRRRALAVVNLYVRESCGRPDRDEQLADVTAEDVDVDYRWLRPDPLVPGDDETAAWCDEVAIPFITDPVTVVSVA